MAHVTDFTCTHCGRPRYEVVTSSRICSACRFVIAAADTQAYMAKLDAMTMEARVRRIELALYELDAEHRLAALETHHVTY